MDRKLCVFTGKPAANTWYLSKDTKIPVSYDFVKHKNKSELTKAELETALTFLRLEIAEVEVDSLRNRLILQQSQVAAEMEVARIEREKTAMIDELNLQENADRASEIVMSKIAMKQG